MADIESFIGTRRKVTKIGNSGHVVLPKEWIGKTVLVLDAKCENEEKKNGESK